MSSSSSSSSSSHQHHHHHHHHQNPFASSQQRPQARIPSDSSSGSSAWHHHHRQHWSADPAGDMDQPFTPEMRDRQARGKDPYLPEASSVGGGDGGGGHGMRMGGGGGGSRQPREPFQKTERRDWAETVLDNPELLMMYSQSSGDTLPATRLKFKKIMCGLDDYESDDASSIPDVSRGPYQSHIPHHHFSTSSSSSGRARGARR